MRVDSGKQVYLYSSTEQGYKSKLPDSVSTVAGTVCAFRDR